MISKHNSSIGKRMVFAKCQLFIKNKQMTIAKYKLLCKKYKNTKTINNFNT